MTVYLAVGVKGYVAYVFDNQLACIKFCNNHPDYHVIAREVHKYQPE